MTPWAVIMLVGLSANVAGITWTALRLRRAFAETLPFLPPIPRAFLQHGYLVALVPAGELFCLWMGNFFHG